MIQGHFRRNYFQLLLGLSLLGAMYPLLEIEGRASITADIVWTVAFCAVLYLALRTIVVKRRELLVARTLMMAAVGLNVLGVVVESLYSTTRVSNAILLPSRFFSLCFLGQSTFAILREVAMPGKVTINRIWGATCVYIMMGLCWAYVFSLLTLLWHESLLFCGEPPTDPANMSLMLYFSFTTLTTLGFGDVVPSTPVARLASGVEAVMGQLFLTVVVARLVGLHITHQRHEEPGHEEQADEAPKDR